MSLKERSRRDFRRFTSDKNLFAIDITFLGKPGAGLDPVTIAGLQTGHYTGYDELGVRMNTRIASVAFAESLLADESIEQTGVAWPIRKTPGGDLLLMDQKIQFVDSTGVLKTWSVKQHFPDENIGCIVLILVAHNVVT